MLQGLRRGGRAGLALVLGLGLLGAVAREGGEGRLTFVEVEQRDDLDGVVTPVISADGKFLYASSWKAATVTVFARDAKTGKLEHRQTISSEDFLQGTTSLAISPNSKFVIASAFNSKSVILFKRNAETGELNQADVAKDGMGDIQFQFPINVIFSPNGKFVYVLDDHGPIAGAMGAVVAFRVDEGTLVYAGTDEGRDGCYQGARGLAFHPDGKTLFVVANNAATLVVAGVDKETGKTSVRQVIKDEEGDAHGLAGVMGVIVSPDGKFVYTSAGRFAGDNAVSAFRLDDQGQLVFLQEFFNGEGALKEFEGGNQITMSADGKTIYAAGTRSSTVAVFGRDRETGKLAYLETRPDGGGEGGELGAAGAAVSPDGKFVYVATEDHKSISVFRREKGE